MAQNLLYIEEHWKFGGGFGGFLRLRVDFDALRPLVTYCSMPCPTCGSYMIRFKYEGRVPFCFRKEGGSRQPELMTTTGEESRRIVMQKGNEHIPTSRLDIRSDYGHIWHLDSYGTQFTNGTLTIDVNGLSLENDWCDPQRLPPWTLKNVGGLLQAAKEVRANPTRFSVMDCFPPKTNIAEVDAQSLALAA
ncbi:hypothetical protein DVH24_034360 [Malus domestica]|uniref:Uncharacterized protein n=1 Tax=Malus domestica TaxID=3750 RepID=A0A498IW83_MALDO|nr:hypothetical protein DVH24_034360 [Malus domestica]